MSDKKLSEIINKILEVIIPDKIILFGSRARGDNRPDSDYDLLIIKSGVENKRKTAQKIYRILINVDTPAGVDIIVKTPEDIEKSKDKVVSVVKEAIKEGIVVYG
jgi:uncharacterized protein